MSTRRAPRVIGRTGARMALIGLLAVVLAACGGGDDGSADPGTTEPGTEAPAGDDGDDDGGTDGEAPGGALDVTNIADRCEELTDIATELRGAAPETVTPRPQTGVSSNDERYQSAACAYGYEGDEFADPNRVLITIHHAPDMTDAQRHEMWDVLAITEPVDGVGDEAQYYYNGAGTKATGSASALVGDMVVHMRVDVLAAMRDETFMTQEPLVAALTEVLARTAG